MLVTESTRVIRGLRCECNFSWRAVWWLLQRLRYAPVLRTRQLSELFKVDRELSLLLLLRSVWAVGLVIWWVIPLHLITRGFYGVMIAGIGIRGCDRDGPWRCTGDNWPPELCDPANMRGSPLMDVNKKNPPKNGFLR